MNGIIMTLLRVAAAVGAVIFSFSTQALETTIGVAETEFEHDNIDYDRGLKAYLTLVADNGVGFEIAKGKYGEYYDLELSSTNIALLASTSGDVVRFYGKLGIAMWEATVDSYYFGTATDDGTDTLLGFGMNLNLGSTVQLKLEVETIDVQDNAQSLNAGIGFRF